MPTKVPVSPNPFEPEPPGARVLREAVETLAGIPGSPLACWPPLSASNGGISSLVPAKPHVLLNDDQLMLWDIFESQKIKALKKNADYGSSVFSKCPLDESIPPGSAILVRMGDKINRIKSLMAREGQNPLVKDESLNDTLCDLAVYCFLLVIHRSRLLAKTGETPGQDSAPASSVLEIRLDVKPVREIVGNIDT